jgi:DNA topoisomerase-2
MEDYDKGSDDRPVEEVYQKKTPLEHILLRPDTYIGAVDKRDEETWVYDQKQDTMVYKNVSFVPGLLKIFDEILVNAADNKVRSAEMNKIKVTIDAETNTISIWNNGKGIPVEMHKVHNVQVPTLIFGELLTGSNFNDDKKRVVGGRNGYGAKLTNIFSTEFEVETVDSKAQKKLKQTWRKNMSITEEPKITSAKKSEDYTQITFKPDLSKFKMDKLDDDIISLMMKRVYDIAGTTTSDVGVYLNGKKLKIKDFKDYVKLYVLDKEIFYEEVNERWKVGISLSDGHMQQVSFVNGVCTTKGGKHVDHVSAQIVKQIKEKIEKKNKGAPIRPQFIKNHLFMFVSALVINPSFDNQTKDTLTTNMNQFGSKCVITEEFMKKMTKKVAINDAVLKFAEYKAGDELKKKSGSKKIRVSGVAKLDDANDAGGKNSDKCTLILTEGDSAKALAISGLSVIGRDNYGVFPLKGKPLNVRDCKVEKVTKNEEISTLSQILGLKYKKVYTKEDLKSLRYGSVMIMADQDHDGSHIKGLLINFIHKFWPSLLEIKGFMKEFITPIVKATNKRTKAEKSFFTIPEYEEWKERNSSKVWDVKYYKGLGTSTAKEAKEYFSQMNSHQKEFKWDGDSAEDKIVTAFAKDKVKERKAWLNAHEDGTFIDYSKKVITYTDFFDKEFVLFSIADCARSIPSLVDGFKPGQRKIMFSCFKRNLRKEIKVAQLCGYVAEHSAYHHGEASLAGTIVNMAQTFVGANNINLLVPSGQFGTRLQGGKDSASPRYIFTKLTKIARQIFMKDDDNVLEYLDDDGQSIEPKYYVPIIPMVLVNGAEGIGTAWSTNIPNFNPIDIVDNIKRLINGEETIDMAPWYKNFDGEMQCMGATKWATRGTIEKIDDTTFEISELPVKVWTQTYKEFLEKILGDENEKIKDYRENHTDLTVSFTVQVSEKQMQHIESVGLYKYFKLVKKLSTGNMTLFTPSGTLKTYASTHEILKDFYGVRLKTYEERKQFLLERLKREYDILDNKVRFIMMIVKDEIIIRKRKKADLLKELVKKKFVAFPKQVKGKAKEAKKEEEADEDEEKEDESDHGDAGDTDEVRKLEDGYSYLLSMPLMTMTLERVKKLENEKAAKQEQLEQLEGKNITNMWLEELDQFVEALGESEQKDIKDEEDYLKKFAQNIKKGKKSAGKIAVSKGYRKTSQMRPTVVTIHESPKKRGKASAGIDEIDSEDEIKEPGEDGEEGEKKKKKRATTKKTTTSTRGRGGKSKGSTRGGKQQTLSFKKEASEDSEEDVKETEEEKKQDSDDEDMGGSLMARLAKKNGTASTEEKKTKTDEAEDELPTRKRGPPVAKRRKVDKDEESGKITQFFQKKTNKSSDDEIEEVEEEKPAPKKKAAPKKATGRLKKKKDEDSEEDEISLIDIESDDEDIEVASKERPKRGALKKVVVSDEESGGEDEEDDNNISDFIVTDNEGDSDFDPDD